VRPFHVTMSKLLPHINEYADAPSTCSDAAGVWSFGIQTSDYHRWVKESQEGIEGMYPIRTAGPLYDKYYEPFVIVRRIEANGFALPRYKEEYVGRFKNKIAFVTTLRASYYKFFTLRKDFLVHVPHSTHNTSSNAMQTHLYNMRKLHHSDRQLLNDHVFALGADPVLERSAFDKGINCVF
jgi:hypothetical protein